MRKISFVAIFTLLFATSCDDYLEGLNENPNSPSTVPITVLMPAAQVNVVDVTGGAFSRFASVIVQSTEGVDRQWASINDYSQMNPATYNTAWNNIYENILVELAQIKNDANALGYGQYEGATNVLLAYTLMMATDVWGDMPYTEALNGVDNLNPVFDTQATIYSEVNSLLTSGITLLSGSDGGLALGAEDLIYGGDVTLWTRAANSLLARMHLHQGNYAQALTAAAAGLASSADNMGYTYPSDANPAQWFRFNRDREGDIAFHPTLRGIMTGLNDTDRLAVLDNSFTTTHPYLTSTHTQELITYRELKFLEAEALLETGGSAAAIRDAYLAGIEASFAEVGASAGYDAYVAQATIDPGVGNITLEMIMTQKYIGLFTHPELFTDWRRTGIPALTATRGTIVPRRFHYGSDELLFNSNAPAEDDISIFTSRVAWDQ